MRSTRRSAIRYSTATRSAPSSLTAPAGAPVRGETVVPVEVCSSRHALQHDVMLPELQLSSGPEQHIVRSRSAAGTK